VLGAVGLDDEVSVQPDEIDLVADQRDIGGREWERVVGADVEDQFLEPGTDLGQGQRQRGEELADDSGASTTGRGIDKAMHPRSIEIATAVHTLEDPAHPWPGPDRGEVPDSSGRGRHGDVLALDDVPRLERARAVDDDAGRIGLDAVSELDVQGVPLPAVEEVDELSCGLMAER